MTQFEPLHINAQARVYARKYHAGANQLIDRGNVGVGVSDPPYVKTNISPVRVSIGNRSIYFFPDRVLAYDGYEIGALAYEELKLDIGTTRFIESGRVPGDAKIVDHTWRFVNKDGGPDKRFGGNSQLPICLYEEIHLHSPSGLNEILNVSRTGLGTQFEASIGAMAKAIESARTAELNRQKEAKTREEEARKAASIQSTETVHFANHKAPTMEELCEALLQILCCVMVADGLATKSERQCIHELLQKVKAPWSFQDVDKRINVFINEVQIAGFKETLRKSLLGVPMFKQTGKGNVLVHCIDAVAAKGTPLNERERFLCDHLKQMVM